MPEAIFSLIQVARVNGSRGTVLARPMRGDPNNRVPIAIADPPAIVSNSSATRTLIGSN